MDRTLAEKALPQLDELLRQFEDIQRRRQADDYSDVELARAVEFVTSGTAAIQRIAGTNSPYASQINQASAIISPYQIRQKIPIVGGALKALRDAMEKGYLDGIQESLHAEELSDFLDMAQALLAEERKNAAMVLIGSVVEGHLRRLGAKYGAPLRVFDPTGASRPRPAEALAADLANRGVLSTIDQKSATAWLALRDHAAQGEAGQYGAEQAEFALQGARDFILRHPA